MNRREFIKSSLATLAVIPFLKDIVIEDKPQTLPEIPKPYGKRFGTIYGMPVYETDNIEFSGKIIGEAYSTKIDRDAIALFDSFNSPCMAVHPLMLKDIEAAVLQMEKDDGRL